MLPTQTTQSSRHAGARRSRSSRGSILCGSVAEGKCYRGFGGAAACDGWVSFSRQSLLKYHNSDKLISSLVIQVKACWFDCREFYRSRFTCTYLYMSYVFMIAFINKLENFKTPHPPVFLLLFYLWTVESCSACASKVYRSNTIRIPVSGLMNAEVLKLHRLTSQRFVKARSPHDAFENSALRYHRSERSTVASCPVFTT